MKISVKMNLLVAVNVVLMVAVVWYGLNKMNLIGNEIAEIAHEDIPLSNVLVEVTNHQLEQEVAMERVLRMAGLNSHGGHEALQAVEQTFETMHSSIEEELHKGEQIALAGLEAAHTDEARAEFTHVDDTLKAIEEHYTDYHKHAAQLFELVNAGRITEAEAMVETIEHEASQVHDELVGLMHEMEKFTESSILTAEEEEHSAMVGMLVIAFASLVIGVSLGMWITLGIRKSLESTNKTIRDMAEHKDLSLRLQEGKDELGEMGTHFNFMATTFQDMLSQLASASTQLASAAEELSVVTAQSHQSVENQKSTTEQMATAINEMSASLHEVASNAAMAADAVSSADKEAEHGKQVVNGTIENINAMAGEVDKTSEVIQLLAGDSENIGKVLEVIRDIAEQTNLLALNAAIEAARAGEQGRGFAVVADEVRTLAQRTQESTQEIQSTIECLQGRARDAVNVMAEGRNQAERSVTHAGDAGASLSEIVSSITTIRDMTMQIASAVEQQSAVSEELNQTVVSINDVSGEVLAGAEQTAQAGEEIAQLAESLKDMVKEFKV